MSSSSLAGEAARGRNVARPRAALPIGLVLLVIAGVLTLVVAANPAHPATFAIDSWWSSVVGNSSQYGFPGIIFENLGGLGAMVIIAVVIISLLCWRHWRSAIFAAVAMMGAPMVVEAAVKPWVERPRPFQIDSSLAVPQNVNHGSFPSGHCASAAALAIVLVAVLPAAWRRWTWVVAALIMLGVVWQRTACNAHWLSDAVAGVCVGAGVALVAWWAFAPLIHKDANRPLRSEQAQQVGA